MNSPVNPGLARTHRASYPTGVIMVLAAGGCLSLGGLILRHIEAADGWQVMFYRSVTFFATLLVFLILRYRGRLVRPFLAIGWPGILLAVLLAVGSIAYIFALIETTVANAMFILSTTPLVTALLAWVVLRERVRGVTWMAIAAAVLGIGLMVANGFATGHLTGNLYAFIAVVTFAGMIVILRRSKGIDMMPATCLAGVFAALVCAPMMGGFAISGHDLMLALLLGTVQNGFGFLLITLGARHIPAAEVSLLALSETVLSPLWVWLAVDEVPATMTMIGGGIVFTAVVAQSLVGLYQDRRATPDRI